MPLVYYTLHGAYLHLLKFGHRHRCPSIVKIRCTTYYMGLAQARSNYKLGQALFAYSVHIRTAALCTIHLNNFVF